MYQNDKIYNTTISIISGLILIVVGILLIIFNTSFYINTINVLLIIAILNGFIQITKLVIKAPNKKNILLFIFNLIFSIFLLMSPKIPQSVFPLILSIYLYLYGLFRIVLYILYFINKVIPRIKELINGLFLIIVGTFIFLFPLNHIDVLLLLIGLYFIVLGSFFVLTALYSNIPIKYKNIYKRKIRVALPVWLEMIVPYTVLIEINKLLSVDELKGKLSQEKIKSIKPSMEIFVHVADKGYNRVGHVDIFYKNKIISYGNYDASSRKFFELVGDGVLFYADKSKYIPFCVEYGKKTLFSFGINLTEKQISQIDQKFALLESNLIQWKPPYTKYKDSKKYNDYTTQLYKATHARFYKFKSGKFKTYFACGVSCCDLVNEIIGYSGIDFLKMNGIISPGTYYDCLNREYVNKTGLVVSRHIYTKNTLENFIKDDIYL